MPSRPQTQSQLRMNEFEKEVTTFHNNLRRLGSKKNRYFAVSYRGIGSVLGSTLVAIVVIALIVGGRSILD